MTRRLFFSLLAHSAASCVVSNIHDGKSIDWWHHMLKGIKFYEHFYSRPYYCSAGQWTIGYGCASKEARKYSSITRSQAHTLLVGALQQVSGVLKRDVKVPLNAHQRAALTSFCFNVGQGTFRKMINTPGRLNDGNYDSVAEILPKYRMGGGKILRGLVYRRKWEVDLWNGKYSEPKKA
jgi:lysozyme